MILGIDIGNTNIKIGVFSSDSDKMLFSWRLAANMGKTSDEYGMSMKDLFASYKLSIADVEGVIISSVLPSLNYTFEHMCEFYWNKRPLMVGKGIKSGIHIKYDNPKEVGADRIVNSVAALRIYGGPCVVVDFGTATTFNMLGDNNDFLGGAICPGIKTSMEALTHSAARLPKAELAVPDTAIGKSTITNMQSGVLLGIAGMVEAMVERFREESGFKDAKVIATGGLSELITPSTTIIDRVDRELTLKGLYYLYQLNSKG